MKIIRKNNKGITFPKGFRAAALNCGIKKSALDLALIVSDNPAIPAAVFTKNVCCAPPVTLSKSHINSEKIKAILVNSGNANAATGEQGYNDAVFCVEKTALILKCEPTEILATSTGIIGVPLPKEKIINSLDKLVKTLSYENGAAAANAILTTDTFKKEFACEIEFETKKVRIGGIAKGSGMIMPNMATMLAFITTDAKIEKKLLQELLKKAVDKTFNRITVDSDTSTNDSVMILANGSSEIEINSKNENVFYEGLEIVCEELAKMIVKDGEGSTKFVTVIAEGCQTETDADSIARSIANSPLVKTALYGGDPNWGRVLMAAGKAGIIFDQNKLDVYFNNILIVKNGVKENADSKVLKKIFNQKNIEIKVNINLGEAKAKVWTCDLSHKYVDINIDYN